MRWRPTRNGLIERELQLRSRRWGAAIETEARELQNAGEECGKLSAQSRKGGILGGMCEMNECTRGRMKRGESSDVFAARPLIGGGEEQSHHFPE